jgi:hypothetical protein
LWWRFRNFELAIRLQSSAVAGCLEERFRILGKTVRLLRFVFRIPDKTWKFLSCMA